MLELASLQTRITLWFAAFVLKPRAVSGCVFTQSDRLSWDDAN